MIKTIKYIVPALLTAVLFSACSSSTQPKMANIEDKLKEQRVEADKCQALKIKKSEKVPCYEKIVDTNSIASLRLAAYNADTLKNYKKSIELFNKTIDAGNYHGKLGLAYMYYKGRGVEKNYDKAHALLSENEAIDANSAYQLSRFYEKGLGTTPKNEAKALQLIEFAANKGLYPAQRKMRSSYKYGRLGLEKNEAKAKEWETKIKNNKDESLFKLYKL